MKVGDIGDYLLISEDGKVKAVSGNTEFWDGENLGWDNVPPNGAYLIVKVIASVVKTVESETRIGH